MDFSESVRIRRTREVATAICAWAICGLTTATGAFGQGGEPVTRALLIGINDYSSPDVPDLKGAVNDVRMLERILTTRFGFVSRNVTVLTDRDATREGILDALADLTRAAAPNDIVYLHFSGHGSQIVDMNGDELEDMLDETILSQDARLEGIPDITDDELERLFGQIRATRTLIVFDSCNSGTITRAPSIVRPRAVPPDDRVDLYRRLTASTRAVVEVQGLPHVLMTGAPAEQQALDGPINDGWYGLFTYAFAQSLDRLGPDATAVEVHDHVKAELQKIEEQLRLTMPEPQLEGPPAKFEQPLLARARGNADEPGAFDEARRAWLEVGPMEGDAVRLRNGLALNARIGSQWAVYDPQETEFEYGNAIALGTVEAIDGSDAILAIRHRNGEIPRNARAIALITASPASSIPVRIDGLASERRRQRRLESSIASRLPAVTFVDESEFARFIVRLEQRAWRVLDAAGLDTALTIPDGDDSVVADRLATVFATSANAASLLALDNPLAEIAVRAQLIADPTRTDASAARGIEVRARPAPTVRIRKPGEPRSASNSLMLEVTSDRDAYITIVDIDAEGGINLLFPNSYQNPDFLPNGFVRGNVPTRIPDSLANGNRAGFSWDYRPPTGKDTIKVIATSDATSANAIRQFVDRIANRQDTLETLRSALAGAAVRGVGVAANVAPAPAAEPPAETSAAAATSAGVNSERQSGRTDWATASIIIEVTE